MGFTNGGSDTGGVLGTFTFGTAGMFGSVGTGSEGTFGIDGTGIPPPLFPLGLPPTGAEFPPPPFPPLAPGADGEDGPPTSSSQTYIVSVTCR